MFKKILIANRGEGRFASMRRELGIKTVAVSRGGRELPTSGLRMKTRIGPAERRQLPERPAIITAAETAPTRFTPATASVRERVPG
jgi:biotin carboxylase